MYDDGPFEPVMDTDVQNELMQMDPSERLVAIDGLLKQALREAVPEEAEVVIDDDDDECTEPAPWFSCDVKNLRILKALTLDSMGRQCGLL